MWIFVMVGFLIVAGQIAHALWVLHYGLTRAPLDARLAEFVQRDP